MPVRYFEDKTNLTFEGGGGKGFAYLGALKAFQNPFLNYLTPNTEYDDFIINTNRVTGIAGASAGSIFAALFGCGVPYKIIYNIIRLNLIQNAMDRDRENDANITKRPDLGFDSGFIENKLPTNFMINDVIKTLSLNKLEFKTIDKAILSIIHLFEEYGFMTGEGIRNLINQYITIFANEYDSVIKRGNKYSIKPTDEGTNFGALQGRGLTFQEHKNIFGFKMHIASVNTVFFRNYGEPFYFNCDTTPNVQIADAVRCSMSIPIAFKPSRFNANAQTGYYGNNYEEKEKENLIGNWIDGGSVGNVPCTAFKDEIDKTKVSKKQLILRLNPPSYGELSNALTYTGESFMTMIGNPSELPIKKYGLSDNQIHLVLKKKNEFELSLFKFKVDDDEYLKKLVEANEQAVLKKLE